MRPEPELHERAQEMLDIIFDANYDSDEVESETTALLEIVAPHNEVD